MLNHRPTIGLVIRQLTAQCLARNHPGCQQCQMLPQAPECRTGLVPFATLGQTGQLNCVLRCPMNASSRKIKLAVPLLAVIGCAACSLTAPISLIDGNGHIYRGSATASGTKGAFSVTDGVLNCSGMYDPSKGVAESLGPIPPPIDLGELPTTLCPNCGGNLWWRLPVIELSAPGSWECAVCQPPSPDVLRDSCSVPLN